MRKYALLFIIYMDQININSKKGKLLNLILAFYPWLIHWLSAQSIVLNKNYYMFNYFILKM